MVVYGGRVVAKLQYTNINQTSGLDTDDEQELNDGGKTPTSNSTWYFDEHMETITVKTFQEKIPKRLGANYLTSADLASLSASFMYYTIPAVKKKRFGKVKRKSKEVDFDVELDEFGSIYVPYLDEGFYDTFVEGEDKESNLSECILGYADDCKCKCYRNIKACFTIFIP